MSEQGYRTVACLDLRHCGIGRVEIEARRLGDFLMDCRLRVDGRPAEPARYAAVLLTWAGRLAADYDPVTGKMLPPKKAKRRGRPRAAGPLFPERDAEIARRVGEGEPLTDIAKGFGISRARAGQIAAKRGTSALRSCATPGCGFRPRHHDLCHRCREAAARAQRPPRIKKGACTCGGCPPTTGGKQARCYWRRRYRESEERKRQSKEASRRWLAAIRAEGGERWERHIRLQKESVRRYQERKRGKAEEPPCP